ncbi:MAG: hypothetical protein ACOYN5_15290 [Bacteroidales bacterium]
MDFTNRRKSMAISLQIHVEGDINTVENTVRKKAEKIFNDSFLDNLGSFIVAENS